MDAPSVAGAAVGASLFDSDLAAFTGAGLGLVAAGLLLPSIRRRVERATLAGLRIELAE